MNTSLLVIDDFYDDPYKVRDYALSLQFTRRGNFPGFRTTNFLSEKTKEDIQKAILPFGGKIKNWFSDTKDSYSGSFQICTYSDRTWIHTDSYNNWAGVLYLTPDAPISSGTSFYRNKEYSRTRFIDDNIGRELDLRDNCFDYTKWEETDVISNKFNRLILFRSDMYHASSEHFGYLTTNCRLTQVFFLDAEYPEFPKQDK